MTESTGSSSPLSGPVTIGEFRARLAEMTDRVLAGEEIVVLRGTQPVARFAPIETRRPKRLGTLNGLLPEDTLRALDKTIDAPLTDAERRTLEGSETDDLGVWTGPARSRTSDHRR